MASAIPLNDQQPSPSQQSHPNLSLARPPEIVAEVMAEEGVSVSFLQ
jgi:hypothetical protein